MADAISKGGKANPATHNRLTPPDITADINGELLSRLVFSISFSFFLLVII